MAHRRQPSNAALLLQHRVVAARAAHQGQARVIRRMAGASPPLLKQGASATSMGAPSSVSQRATGVGPQLVADPGHDLVEAEPSGHQNAQMSHIGGRAREPKAASSWPLPKNFLTSTSPCRRHERLSPVRYRDDGAEMIPTLVTGVPTRCVSATVAVPPVTKGTLKARRRAKEPLTSGKGR